MPELPDLRAQIDALDTQLLETLARRFEVTKQVGEYKAANRIPVQDVAREKAQLERLRSLAVEHGLNPDFVAEFWTLLFRTVVEEHLEIAQQAAFGVTEAG